ncbi:MAG: LysR family transcriptional regulator [Bacteroidales bacterium]
MDIRLLKFFVAVYEQKNLSRAAEQCFVSQPNISNGIKQLEEEIDQILFIRHKRGVIIKEEAHFLYPIAQRILNDTLSLKEIFKNKKLKNKISIGIADSLPQKFKSSFFQQITKEIDHLELELREINRDCELNLLIREWKFEDHLFLPLLKENYVLCIPNSHPLVKKEIIELNDLKKQGFIHCPACESHQQSLAILSSSGDQYNIVANCKSKNEVLSTLIAGLGITFLPEEFAKPWEGFQIKKFNGPQHYREIGLSYAKECLSNPNIANLIHYFSNKKRF